MGWQYNDGADMSASQYLAINPNSTSSDSHLNNITDNSIWSPCCSTPDFGSKKQIVLDLSTAKYTSDGDKKGKALDTKNIRIVSFWGTGSKTIVVDDMYLTNNDDYTRETVKTEGDVNGDGAVDVADISAIISVMAGSDTNEEDADVNHDGTVDVADIASVIDIMANNARLLFFPH